MRRFGQIGLSSIIFGACVHQRASTCGEESRRLRITTDLKQTPPKFTLQAAEKVELAKVQLALFVFLPKKAFWGLLYV